MNIALWVVQVLLALGFGMIGSMKVFNYAKFKAQAGKDAPTEGLTKFIGVSEMAGAVGMVLPWATGVLPILTPVAASALALVMVLALGHHAQHKHAFGKKIPALVFLVLSLIVAWGRF